MLIEGILTVVILVLFLLFIGIPLDVIIEFGGFGILGLAGLAMALFSLFFAVTLITLPLFRMAKGHFVRFSDDLRWDRAVYDVNGTEYTCIFPAESVGRKFIYRNKDRLLLISRFGHRKIAYDRHSILIIAIGSFTSVGFVIVLVTMLRIAFDSGL